MAYSQALETLFALLCSAIQAPNCVVGWMLSYKNIELESLVRKVTRGMKVHCRFKEYPSWEFLAKSVHSCLGYDQSKVEWIQKGFGHLWRSLANDLTNEKIAQEYNSAKHGLRSKLGGFSLASGIEETPGAPVPSEKMKPLGGSIFGTSFYRREKIGDARLNFRPRLLSRNWDPANIANSLGLLAMSINNTVGFLRVLNGTHPQECNFLNPANPAAFDEPWRDSVG